jgi:hypothetical protein
MSMKLVAQVVGLDPDNQEYNNEFVMDVTNEGIMKNEAFWTQQVKDFLEAARRGHAILHLDNRGTINLRKEIHMTDTVNTVTPITAATLVTESVEAVEAVEATETTTETKVEIMVGMPIPSMARGRKRAPLDSKYPFASMAVGSSFVVSGKKEVQTARNATQLWAKEHGPAWKFTTRNVSGMPNPSGGVYPEDSVGIWRVPPTSQVASSGKPSGN